jgi:hypothetical protein
MGSLVHLCVSSPKVLVVFLRNPVIGRSALKDVGQVQIRVHNRASYKLVRGKYV